MTHEAEMPGRMLSMEEWQMICLRYHTIGQFVHEKQILEVGCGAGIGLDYLSTIAEKVIGGDLSEENIRCAHYHYGNKMDLLLLDAHRLPFEDESLDVVVAMEVIFYLRFDEFLEECNRVLRKEGVLIFCLPNKDREDGFHESPLSNKYYSVPELYRLLREYQFDADFFGAFPVSRYTMSYKIQNIMILNAGKVLDLLERLPKGKEFRRLLNKIILNKTLVLQSEIVEEDMKTLENIQLQPLPCESPDFRHKIIYAIAHTRY